MAFPLLSLSSSYGSISKPAFAPSLLRIFSATMSMLVLPLALPFLLVLSLYQFFSRLDSREPPLIPQSLPFVGHILGLLFDGHIYLEKISAVYDLPIYALRTFATRIYVVNSPELVIAVQRNAKTISFTPFVVAMLPRLFNVSSRDIDVAGRNHDEEDGHWGYMADVHSSTYSVLAPGVELDSMVRPLLENMMDHFDELSNSPGDGVVMIDLFAWIRRTITAASTSAVYGPENPFACEQGLETAFWDLEQQFTVLLLGILPSFTARKACRGRAELDAAMQRYFIRGGHEQGSGLVKARYHAGKRHGLSLKAISAFELGDCIGVLINSVPSTFWLLYHIFSCPELLSSIRDELNSSVTPTGAISVLTLQNLCPLLLATYKEVLRYRTHSSSSRYVRQDTVLDSRYLLKKGSIIQIPGAVIHRNSELWGAGAKEFNPRRFLKNPISAFPSSASLMSAGSDHSTDSVDDLPNNSLAVKRASFRAFGGGATLCPGRHFATSTLLAVVAMVVLRFDIAPVSGKWGSMKQATGRLASTIPPPEGDIKVYVRKRSSMNRAWDLGGKVPRFEI